ncbi:hypothetical protein KC678_05290 [Candidatus Dojkabacteria bacterium]|uniref:Uncharacterized protein n=1 Tax=Candidatus Dojkabacteria bacterium TaxID=2099670 RepID=A0A955L2E9_9BACT|nr:hypothetical protein [Candidatus Dojkabacteria bacterium]
MYYEPSNEQKDDYFPNSTVAFGDIRFSSIPSDDSIIIRDIGLVIDDPEKGGTITGILKDIPEEQQTMELLNNIVSNCIRMYKDFGMRNRGILVPDFSIIYDGFAEEIEEGIKSVNIRGLIKLIEASPSLPKGWNINPKIHIPLILRTKIDNLEHGIKTGELIPNDISIEQFIFGKTKEDTEDHLYLIDIDFFGIKIISNTEFFSNKIIEEVILEYSSIFIRMYNYLTGFDTIDHKFLYDIYIDAVNSFYSFTNNKKVRSETLEKNAYYIDILKAIIDMQSIFNMV